MSREKVCYFEVVCDRCGKREKVEEKEFENGSKSDAAMHLILGKEEILYNDLCRRCRDRMEALLEQIKVTKKERVVRRKRKNGRKSNQTQTTA